MPMNPDVLVAIGSRVMTLIWPLANEALAAPWWASSAGPSRLPTFLIIAAYVSLVFAPSRFLFSRSGVAPVLLLLFSSSLLLLRYWSEPNGVPQMIWVYLGFAFAWVVTFLVERLIRRTPR